MEQTSLIVFYISEDPIGLAGGIDNLAYVLNRRADLS